MKRSIIIALALILLLCSCDKSPNGQTANIGDTQLPKNLVLGIDLASVTSPETAKTYKAEYHEFDEEFVQQNMLRGKVVSSKEYAQGLQYIAEGQGLTEYLTVCNNTVKGGIYYTLYRGDATLAGNIQPVFSKLAGYDDVSAQAHRYGVRGNYTENGNLGFMQLSDAENAVQSSLTKLSFPELALETSYALDSQTLNKQYELYFTEQDGSVEELVFDSDDDLYYLQFRQTVDGIPLINVNWQEGERNYTTETFINVFYSKHGIEDIYSERLCDIMDDGVSNNVISPDEALRIIAEDYSQIILSNVHTISSLELCYITVVDGDALKLLPAWVFVVQRDAIWEDPATNMKTDVVEYKYHVLNASTGEFIRKAG